MKHKRAALAVHTPLLWIAMGTLAAAIFAADTATNLEIAVAVLYVAVVLMSVWSGRPSTVLLVGVGCGTLTIVSFVLTRTGSFGAGLANCGLSLLAIGATTYLAIRIEDANTAAQQALADLAHMSRLTTIGELGTSIAHEVSQPLAAIVANGNAALHWLSASPANEEEARRAMGCVVEAAGRAGEVIARVRQLVTRAPPSRGTVDMVEMILETLAFIRGEIRRNQILLRTELASDLPTVTGDRVQLQQVVLNFVINAVEALSGVGGDGRELLISAATDGSKITISVRDTGTGLAPTAYDRAFDAFHSTKPTGMGIGLTISRSIVEAHGGMVYAAPNYPHGAVFGFTVPIVGKATD